MSQDSSARLADISARLDKLEQKAAAPPAPDPGLTDLAARLDKLEKKATVASAPEAADGGAKPDKKAVVPAGNSVDGGVKADKKPVVPAATSAGPPPSTLQQQAMLAARAGASASNDIARSPSARPLLQEYRVEDVQGGVAVIGSRYGQQRAALGDLIPGAGRVLGIERQGGGWFVVTSLGIIASAPATR